MESAIANLFVGKIASIIENEAAIIGGVSDEFHQLKLELESMQASIVDAEKANALKEVDKVWVKRAKEICYPVEDIIDEFIYYITKHKNDTAKSSLKRLSHLPMDLWVRRKVAKKIEKINQKLKAIPERRSRYNPPSGTEGGWSHHQDQDKDDDDQRRRARHQSESLVVIPEKDRRTVGIEEDVHLIINNFLTTEEPERKIMSIVGMGGSGKTTLAAKVYNSPSTKRRFDCYAWITVSNNYHPEDLMRTMIQEFYSSQMVGHLSSLPYKGLLRMLVDYLRSKRYIVVFDDVWDVNFWKEMSFSLPDGGPGSRVILTTRHRNIAIAAQSKIHDMRPLKVQEAWDLFCATAFINNNGVCAQELQRIAHKLVEKCGGVPLAILALGGALSSKSLQSEWMDFSDSLNHQLNNNDDLEEVKKRILLFSFNDLSYPLKRCFLYCCVFPEDHRIKRKRLIRLWMAEGFVKQVRSRTPELIGDDYLLELVHRNMLQVVEMNETGRPKRCKLHDMMRELAISMSEDEKFCFVYDGQGRNEEMDGTSIRRFSVQKSSESATNLLQGSVSVLRSLFVFVSDLVMPTSSVVPSLYKFRLMRVLDLEGLPVEKLPDELGSLFNLRYLNLEETKVKELPESIGKLRNLQTLNTKASKIKKLPAGVARLENLRHLKLYRQGDESSYSLAGTAVPYNIYKLKQLQVLDGVEAEARLMKELKSMTQLTTFGIANVRKEDEEELCKAISGMNLVRSLSVRAIDEEEYLGVNLLSSAPPCLKMLWLSGKMEKVPSWFLSLHNLTCLNLVDSRLSEEDHNHLVPHIQSLPNLGKLDLWNAYSGDELCFSAGFSKLKMLYLQKMPQLKKIVIDKGVMPHLQKLTLDSCKELKMVPHGIEHLAQLQVLHIRNMSQTELVRRIYGEESIDRPKVRHIPEIKYYFQNHYDHMLFHERAFAEKEALNSMV